MPSNYMLASVAALAAHAHADVDPSQKITVLSIENNYGSDGLAAHFSCADAKSALGGEVFPAANASDFVFAKNERSKLSGWFKLYNKAYGGTSGDCFGFWVPDDMAGYFTADDWKVGDEFWFYKQEVIGDMYKPRGEIYFEETFDVDGLEAQIERLTAELSAKDATINALTTEKAS